MAKRLFTPDEANRALPEVRELAERMVAAGRALERARTRQEELAARIGGNGGGIGPQELASAGERVRELADELADCLNGIHELGVVVKDFEIGLVDFPSLRDGEEVLLCWHVGEDEVAYWHDLQEGYAGRKPIDEG